MARFEPYPYQRRMIDMIHTGESVGLWAKPGSGKTVSVLTAIEERFYDYLDPVKVLILAPKFVSDTTWPNEIEKWDHLEGLTYQVLVGSPKERAAMLEDLPDLTIMCRNLLPWLFRQYTKTYQSGGWRWLKNKPFPFDVVVIDEASVLKRPSGKWFKTMARLARSDCQVIELTGTPSPRNIEDLWSQAFLLDRGERLEDGIGKFRARWMEFGGFLNIGSGRQIPKLVPKADAYLEIMDLLRDRVVTIDPNDWIDMPDQIDRIIEVDLPAQARMDYNRLLRDRVLYKGGHIITGGSQGVIINKLLQICNGNVYDEDKETVPIHTVKFDALDEVIASATGPVLIFYSYKHDLPELMRRHPGAKQLKGKTQEDAWNRGEIPIMFAHPASAGHGLNLQAGGSDIIWLGLPFDLELYQQANARLVRQGQKAPVVFVHHLLAKDTLDQIVLKALRRKDLNQDRIMEEVRFTA